MILLFLTGVSKRVIIGDAQVLYNTLSLIIVREEIIEKRNNVSRETFYNLRDKTLEPLSGVQIFRLCSGIVEISLQTNPSLSNQSAVFVVKRKTSLAPESFALLIR